MQDMIGEMWTEKYRPKKLDEIVGQTEVVRRLKSLVEKKSLPHCLFTGPAGVGKTTCALAIANEFWKDSWRANFLETNASDERGIDTIRNKVKDFARTMAVFGGFKIVYLDEADSLTRDAQHALRRIMESFSASCRFILACNFSSRIITPIQSRCAVFRFSPLHRDDVVNYIRRIAENECLEYEPEALNALYDSSEGDMRKAINLMQSSAFDGVITKEKIFSLARRDPARVGTMLALAREGKFRESRDVLTELLSELSGEDVVKEMHRQIIEWSLPDAKKLSFLEKVGEGEWRVSEGADAKIQLEALLAWIAIEGRK